MEKPYLSSKREMFFCCTSFIHSKRAFDDESVLEDFVDDEANSFLCVEAVMIFFLAKRLLRHWVCMPVHVEGRGTFVGVFI